MIPFFFGEGTLEQESPTGQIIFDGLSMAHSFFVQSGGQQNFQELSNFWATQMAAAYRNNPPPNLRAGKIVTEGYFVGVQQNKIAFGATALRFEPRIIGQFILEKMPSARFAIVAPGQVGPFASSYDRLVDEFVDGGRTQRAKTILLSIQRRTAGMTSSADRSAVKAMAIVKAVEDWSQNEGFGGDTAVIIIERTSGRRWFHRPDYCSEN